MNIELIKLMELKACTSGITRFKSLHLGVATLEQTLSVCTVGDVLWYLGKDPSNLNNIVEFANWCAKAAAKAAAKVTSAEAAAGYAVDAVDAADAAKAAARAAGYAARAAGYAADAAKAAADAAKAAADAANAAAGYAADAAKAAGYDAAELKQKSKLLGLFK
jgi:hypothetical protein